jgi:hypothetical protein
MIKKAKIVIFQLFGRIILNEKDIKNLIELSNSNDFEKE